MKTTMNFEGISKALAMAALMALGQEGLLADQRVYTLNGDFSEGTLVNLDMDSTPGQLQLGNEQSTLPFIWVPNQNSTLSKFDTRTGKELARYHLGPASGFNGQPSRTTVDLMGNCWVANRHAGSVVKVGLSENGEGVDRNGNGKIDTCTDLNDNGDIEASEMLPWGQDECVLFEVILIRNKEGTFVPGTYTGGYTDDWGDTFENSPGPRSLAVDKFNNCWVGCLGTQKFHYVDGATGAILRTLDVSPWDHRAYGATIDADGRIWSVSHGRNRVLRITPSSTDPVNGPLSINNINVNHTAYGINVDSLGHVFCSGWDQGYSRIRTLDGAVDWTKYNSYTQSRGVAVTPDNDVWIANTAYSLVMRFDNNGNLKAVLTGMGFNQPSGVAVDADGKLWVCNIADENILRINPANNTVDLVKQVVGSWGHYTYSDMTGVTVRNVTRKIGNWTVEYDSGRPGATWGRLGWNGDTPEGTAIDVRARSSETRSGWSSWETAENGQPLTETPAGRYLQVESTMSGPGGAGSVTPVLYDLTVGTRCPSPVAAYQLASNTGYYVKLLATSECYTDLRIYVADPVTAFVAGPYAPGDIVRITRGTSPKAMTGKPPVKALIYLSQGDAKIFAVDPEDQSGPAVLYRVR